MVVLGGATFLMSEVPLYGSWDARNAEASSVALPRSHRLEGFRVQGSGFRVQGSGFRVQGSGVRVRGDRQGSQESSATRTKQMRRFRGGLVFRLIDFCITQL